jgi:hypothetical protein
MFRFGGASVTRGVSNRRNNPYVAVVITVFFLWAPGHKQRVVGGHTFVALGCRGAEGNNDDDRRHSTSVQIDEPCLLGCWGRALRAGSRFFWAFPSAAAVATAAKGTFFEVLFGGTLLACGDVAVSAVSAPTAASATAFLSVASRCLVKPTRSGR